MSSGGSSGGGGSLLFVALISTSMTYVAAKSVELSLAERRVATNTLHAKQAQYCAETGLERLRGILKDASVWDKRNINLTGGITTEYNPAKGYQGTCTDGLNFTVWISDNLDDSDTLDTDGIIRLTSKVYSNEILVAQTSALINQSHIVLWLPSLKE